MLKSIIPFLMLVLLFACGGSGSGSSSMIPDANKPGLDVAPDDLTTTIDLVCKMDMGHFKITDTLHHNGGVYAFCSSHCKGLFKEEPAKYLATSK